MVNGKIDFRSDTVTLPTDEMRKAMAEAIVGDDVYGDDETINRLEKITAKKFKKDAALFVPTGTMSNQLAIFTHAERGNEIILPDNCHIVVHEAGAASVIAGVQLRCIQTKNGQMPYKTLENTIRKQPDDIQQPKTALITYENADSAGMVRNIEYMKNIKSIAEKYNIPVHVDGARIFNAAYNLGVDVKEFSPYFDTISVCLSKGLCAPVGSLLVGSSKFIKKARRKRKLMGGGMRQAGILGAAGIIAIEQMTKRIGEDHKNAQYLAQELSKIEGIEVFKEQTQINMVFFSIKNYKFNSNELVKYLAKNNIIINGEEEGVMRLVTHYWTERNEIDTLINLLK